MGNGSAPIPSQEYDFLGQQIINDPLDTWKLMW